MPLVTVVIPNYNHAIFLQERIESVINQTFQDIELIVLDDASTDNSLEIINRYKNRINQIIVNTKNSGSVFRQWGKAIALCNTKYLWIAESDDWAENTFLEKSIQFAERHQNISLVFCNSNFLNDNNLLSRDTASEQLHNIPFRFTETFVMDGVEFAKKILIYGCAIPNVSAVLFKTEALKEMNNKYCNFTICGDWYLYLQLCKTGSIGYLDIPLSNFRQHEQSVSYKRFQQIHFFKECFTIISSNIHYYQLKGTAYYYYVKKINRYITIFGLPFNNKIKIALYYFKTNPKLAFCGLFYNIKNRIAK